MQLSCHAPSVFTIQCNIDQHATEAKKMNEEKLDEKFRILAEKFMEDVKKLHNKHGENCSIEITVRS